MNTQALSGAGLLKIINRATDAVSKMTIKMNESDIVCKIQLDFYICIEMTIIQTQVVSILRFLWLQVITSDIELLMGYLVRIFPCAATVV